MSDHRAAILARLKAAPRQAPPPLPPFARTIPPAERLGRFRATLEGFHAVVVDAPRADWPRTLRRLLDERGVGTLMYGPRSALGQRLAAGWDDGGPALLAYDTALEEGDTKDRLVHRAQAAVTSTLGGIAETGSLIVWPTPEEPRLMSLLPPLHVAVVDPHQLYGTLAEAVTTMGWAKAMPTNALLISGPSKTADIESTLAYGVHGPKELLVLILTD